MTATGHVFPPPSSPPFPNAYFSIPKCSDLRGDSSHQCTMSTSTGVKALSSKRYVALTLIMFNVLAWDEWLGELYTDTRGSHSQGSGPVVVAFIPYETLSSVLNWIMNVCISMSPIQSISSFGLQSPQILSFKSFAFQTGVSSGSKVSETPVAYMSHQKGTMQIFSGESTGNAC